MEFIYFGSLGKVFEEDLLLSEKTLDALKTTPRKSRLFHWLFNRGHELIMPEKHLDLTSFRVRMRQRVWSVLNEAMLRNQPNEVVLVEGGRLGELVEGLVIEPGYIFGMHPFALFPPEEDRVPIISHTLAADIESFVRHFSSGIACVHFRVFADGDDIIGCAYKERRVTLAPLPDWVQSWDPSESPEEARARVLNTLTPSSEDHGFSSSDAVPVTQLVEGQED